jgi:predicted transcriptional regulator
MEQSTNESRRRMILERVREDGRAQVTHLATVLDVAVETVRRDLRALEDHGLVRRTHGGALPVDKAGFESDISQRSGQSVAQKQRRGSNHQRPRHHAHQCGGWQLGNPDPVDGCPGLRQYEVARYRDPLSTHGSGSSGRGADAGSVGDVAGSDAAPALQAIARQTGTLDTHRVRDTATSRSRGLTITARNSQRHSGRPITLRGGPGWGAAQRCRRCWAGRCHRRARWWRCDWPIPSKRGSRSTAWRAHG